MTSAAYASLAESALHCWAVLCSYEAVLRALPSFSCPSFSMLKLFFTFPCWLKTGRPLLSPALLVLGYAVMGTVLVERAASSCAELRSVPATEWIFRDYSTSK